jgi:choline dehydrogenase-like flavoprotein
MGSSCRSNAFNWENIQNRFKNLETFHPDVPKDAAKYVTPLMSNHGIDGPIHTGFAAEWEKDVLPLLDTCEKAGFQLNKDHNSGNPIGMSVITNSSYRGRRSTAADALMSAPENLTILTDCVVECLIIEDGKVTGVNCNSGQCECIPIFAINAPLI